MNVETRRERVFQAAMACARKGWKYIQKMSGLILPTGKVQPSRWLSTDSHQSWCPGYKKSFKLPSPEGHFSVMWHKVQSSGEFWGYVSLRHTAAQGKGFVKIRLLSWSQNGGVAEPGWGTAPQVISIWQELSTVHRSHPLEQTWDRRLQGECQRLPI